VGPVCCGREIVSCQGKTKNGESRAGCRNKSQGKGSHNRKAGGKRNLFWGSWRGKEVQGEVFWRRALLTTWGIGGKGVQRKREKIRAGEADSRWWRSRKGKKNPAQWGGSLGDGGFSTEIDVSFWRGN